MEEDNDLEFLPLTPAEIEAENERDRLALKQTLGDWEPEAQTEDAVANAVQEEIFEELKHGIYRTHDGHLGICDSYDREAERIRIAERWAQQARQYGHVALNRS